MDLITYALLKKQIGQPPVGVETKTLKFVLEDGSSFEGEFFVKMDIKGIWKFNSTVTLDSIANYNLTFNYTYNGVKTANYIKINNDNITYDNLIVYQNQKWINSGLQTITITDVSKLNAEELNNLTKWLIANAIKQ